MPTPCSGEIDRRQAQVDAKSEAIAGSGRFAPGSRGALLHRAPADAGLAQAEFFPINCSFDHLVDAHEEQGRNCVLWPRAWASSHAWRSRRFLDMDFAVSGPLVQCSRLVPGFCPSTRTFALRFLQTSPRGDSPCVVANPSPPSGWVEDFHLRATEHAQHTTKSLRDSGEVGLVLS